jgi:uncharacterized membrane protein YhhN
MAALDPYVLVTLAAVAALMVAEATHRPTLRAVAKTTASTAFCLYAWSLSDGGGATYDRLILAALVCSWWGDVLLLSKRDTMFMGGLGAFLLGHVAFAAAFWQHGTSSVALGASLLGFGLVARVVWRWLSPHVRGAMRAPVVAYVLVITVMVSLATAATMGGGSVRMLVGATAFFVSDLAVARDRFVAPGVSNRMWGLPLYYGAQLVLASTVG